MNEEEKQAIDYFKNLDISFNTLLRIELKGFENAVNTILNLIDKQQKEIEDLKDKCKELIFEKQELTSALLDSIPEDKIKEKIKEIETSSMLDFVEKEKFDFKYSLEGIYCMQKGVVFILKELLGE